MVELVEVDSRETVVEAEEEANVTGGRTTHLHVTSMGCVAIWLVTVPAMRSHRGVAMLCPPEEDFPNPGDKAQIEVVENVQFALVA